jgi:hypothetical protein
MIQLGDGESGLPRRPSLVGKVRLDGSRIKRIGAEDGKWGGHSEGPQCMRSGHAAATVVRQ